MTDAEAPEARPEDVACTLTWLADGDALQGELTVRNIGEHRIRLSGKPRLIPLDGDGHPLETDTIVTLELRMPG
ncbi:MAG TPA: hypothetical protein VH298_01925, partial [Jatrophihabitans sp.]|nr:hypothetical protein [Jatrophihabitans sp.]